ncbi:hypothetical protein JCM8547_000099 [Rhodosporidiobolus lusitaniae]
MPSSQLVPNPTTASSRRPAPSGELSEGRLVEDGLANVDAWTAECQQAAAAAFPILNLLPFPPSALQRYLSMLPELDVPVETIPRLLPDSLLLEHLVPYFPEDVLAIRPQFLELKKPGAPIWTTWLEQWCYAFSAYAWKILARDDAKD